jgi:hypothetical protein
MKTVIILGDMERRGTRMPEVACRKCERRGRLSIARLIGSSPSSGAEDHGDLRALIAHNCPRMQNPAVLNSSSAGAPTSPSYRGGFVP